MPKQSNDPVEPQELDTDPTLDAPEEELTPLSTPGTDIEVNENAEPPQPAAKTTRIARALEVYGDEVTNVIMVVVDEDDNVVGYEVEYGYELVIVEDDSPVSIGWFRVDGDFVDPNAE